MNYRFTETEIKKLLKENFMILYDTREQKNKNQHILDYFDKKKINYKRQKIDEGDYTAIITKCEKMGIYRDLYFPIGVERKNSVDELAGNLGEETDTHDDIRLIRELRRAKEKGIKIFLLIEDEHGRKNIKTGNYRSLYLPISFMARLRSLQDQFLNGTVFINKNDSGEEIFGILKYAVRNFLKGGYMDIGPEEMDL
ncbi:ERCC4 domain-containing protein [Clostridium estertheticum]|uniref:ERCC4 domain-containing protein n=1 Tax=Clostridium estertheticum TaxID=238834 RepID=UPI001CF1E6B8|nr:ERCC4 domain-containing protein [Clostridium estertheticum]MCB2309006.1 ERCC4 domain-containing protein [Clostridium estertheticum]MCB2346860.1 ERCC4 domain-containing protein [Clostridium estertheticum]MCB2351828.1 ERCC4 domain-containing protein [Clostridium estertheticum]WAG48432.1 ERCC4 domain-containing protein [Clostridium estertheticum]